MRGVRLRRAARRRRHPHAPGGRAGLVGGPRPRRSRRPGGAARSPGGAGAAAGAQADRRADGAARRRRAGARRQPRGVRPRGAAHPRSRGPVPPRGGAVAGARWFLGASVPQRVRLHSAPGGGGRRAGAAFPARRHAGPGAGEREPGHPLRRRPGVSGRGGILRVAGGAGHGTPAGAARGGGALHRRRGLDGHGERLGADRQRLPDHDEHRAAGRGPGLRVRPLCESRPRGPRAPHRPAGLVGRPWHAALPRALPGELPLVEIAP
jgi:hypothetical protein